MLDGKIIGKTWKKNSKTLSLEITTNTDRVQVAEVIKQNLEEIGIKVTIRELSNSYYKNNIEKLKYEILLTGNMVSIKPNIQEYLKFKINKKQTEEEKYKEIYDRYKKEPNFIGLYFDSIILLYSKNLRGNFECNWYNVFYNIDTWYKVIE